MANPGHNTINVQTPTYEAFYAAVRHRYGSKRGALAQEATNALKAYLPKLTQGESAPKEKKAPAPTPPATKPPMATSTNPSNAASIQPSKATATNPSNAASIQPSKATATNKYNAISTQPTKATSIQRSTNTAIQRTPTEEDNPYQAPCGKDCKNPEGLKRHHEEGCLECTDLKLASKEKKP